MKLRLCNYYRSPYVCYHGEGNSKRKGMTMHNDQQIRQGDVPATEPPEPHLYLEDDCCGMMFFSDKPPAPKPREPHKHDTEEYSSH